MGRCTDPAPARGLRNGRRSAGRINSNTQADRAGGSSSRELETAAPQMVATAHRPVALHPPATLIETRPLVLGLHEGVSGEGPIWPVVGLADLEAGPLDEWFEQPGE